jgi:hypothetical protein
MGSPAKDTLGSIGCYSRQQHQRRSLVMLSLLLLLLSLLVHNHPQGIGPPPAVDGA